MAFRGEQSSGGEDGLEDLTKAIIEDVLRMPGNEVCCDCGAAGVCACVWVCGCVRLRVSLSSPGEVELRRKAAL